MNYRILTDDDVGRVEMARAIEWMEEAFRQHAAGNLVAPGRIESDLGVGRLVFTTGASTATPPTIGFRCYDLQQLHSLQRSELTAIFAADDGRLRGLVVGPLLGALRTGAIGGVAIKHLSRPDTAVLGLIGTGFQARTQLAAALAVRQFDSIKVFSRTERKLSMFVKEMSHQLSCELQAVASAQAAVEGADVLLCTTTSGLPVVDAGWLKPGVHINNVGPKFKDRHEIGRDVIASAARLVTDAPAQVEEYGDRLLLHGLAAAGRLETLSSIVAKNAPLASDASPATSLFISLGLAGTEVLLAQQLVGVES